MYVHCKAGFVEADRWDGQRIPVQAHHAAVCGLRRKSPSRTVVVLRSRARATLGVLVSLIGSRRKVYESPAGWDYPFRAYVTAEEWSRILAEVALGLDYRNFKSWTAANCNETDRQLAHEIWHAAHAAAADRLSRFSW